MQTPGYKAGLCSFPNEGDKQLEYTAVIPASGVLSDDLFEELASNQLGYVQSIWIDNSDNPSAFTITFPGINRGYRITVQAYHSGWFPVSAPIGALRFTINGTPSDTRTLIFSNVMMPYIEWGPIDGVLVVPALSAGIINIDPRAGDGTAVLVAPLAAASTKIYRLQFTVDNGCTVQFQDTAGNVLSGKITLFAGGSITWQASGVPWIVSAINNGIQLVFTGTGGANIVVGGLIGYIQN